MPRGHPPPGRGHGRVLDRGGRVPVILLSAAATAGVLAWPAPAGAAEGCAGHPPPSAVGRVSVLEAPLSVRSDFNLADLGAMASRLSQAPPHPALGFCQGVVGYRLRVTASDTAGPPSSCPRVEVRAQLVALERRIEVGSELRDSPCELRAALAHYRRHAAAASLALRAYAADLDGRLREEVARDLRGHPPRSAADLAALEGRLGAFLDASLAAFNQSLPAVQAGVDASREAHALGTGCASL